MGARVDMMGFLGGPVLAGLGPMVAGDWAPPASGLDGLDWVHRVKVIDGGNER